MASSQINKAIKSIWKKADLVGALSYTLFRKSAVSSIHSSNESNEARGNLVDLMVHNITTPNKYYRLQEKSNSSVLTSKELCQVIRQAFDSSQAISRKALEASESPSEELLQTGDSSSCSSSLPVKTSIMRLSLDEEKEKVKLLFEQETTNKMVTMDIVKEKISFNQVPQDEDPKRILDKLQGKWHFATEAVAPIHLPVEKATLDQPAQRSLPTNAVEMEILTGCLPLCCLLSYSNISEWHPQNVLSIRP